ncbi:MAG: hypothetical protein Q8O31_01325 [Rhodocyclaceae bacterium]|nr:hypothetical protein [Rhodocyclaceae bacterium]
MSNAYIEKPEFAHVYLPYCVFRKDRASVKSALSSFPSICHEADVSRNHSAVAELLE